MFDAISQVFSFIASPWSLWIGAGALAVVALGAVTPILAPVSELLKPAAGAIGRTAVIVAGWLWEATGATLEKPARLSLIVAVVLATNAYAQAQSTPKLRASNTALEKCLAKIPKAKPATTRRSTPTQAPPRFPWLW